MLIEIFERRSPETNRKSIVYRLRCDACDAIIEGCKCRFERSTLHFCNTKCSGKYKHEHPESMIAAIAAFNSPESHAKSRATIKAKAAKGEWRHWLGKHHSEETKKHLSEIASDGRRKGAGNAMFGRHHKESSKEKMSDAKTRLIIEGKFQAYGTNNKKGWHASTKTGETCFFRSGWEEALMKHFDADVTVQSWAYEKLRISYVYHENKRWYVPDFLVTRTDGSRQLVEVKPKEFTVGERVKLKTEAGEQWCRENNAQMVIVTRDVFRSYGIHVV